MIYIQYEEFKKKYFDAQKLYDELLTERDRLFARTQPRATEYDRESVKSGQAVNTFEEYVIAKERTQIDKRIAEAQRLLEDRAQLLKIKENELRESSSIVDRVYLMRIIERKKVSKIASAVNYSEAQIYRILKEISTTLKMIENDSF